MIAFGGACLAALALALGWSQRGPIARDAIDELLRSNRVSGAYRITRFGIASQTIEQVRLGDPAHPDLVARRATVHLAYRFGWPRVAGIEAEGVRLSGRIVDGRLSLGALDRLLPASGGGGFALPDLALTLRDAALRLETPAGPALLTLAGSGHLADGFRGTLVAAMPAAGLKGCRVIGLAGRWTVRTAAGEPSLVGPVRADRLACAGMTVARPAADLDLTLSRALDGWRGSAVLASGAVAGGGVAARAASGRIAFTGNAQAISGQGMLTATRVTAPRFAAESAGFEGRFGRGRAGVSLAGEARASGAMLAEGGIARQAAIATGTPAGPALAALAVAATRAAKRFDARVLLAASDGALGIERVDATSASGAALVVRPADGGREALRWANGGLARVSLHGVVAGGGLPAIDLRAAGAGGALAGEARIAPFASGWSRVALDPVRFDRSARGVTRFRTVVTLDGPVGDGRVEALSLPIAGENDGHGLWINRGCVPLRFARLSIAGTVLGPGDLPLCPLGEAMLTPGGGGVRLPGARVTGQVGGAPLTIATGPVTVALGAPGFTAQAVAVRLGDGADPTRLDLPTLDGRFATGGVTGRFAGLSGKIGKVPLPMSAGAGTWTLARGELALAGTIGVADEATPARFEPLVAHDVALRLEGGRILTTGHLLEPKTARPVAAVTVRHDLRTGTGDARLAIERLTFDEALQPEALTRLTLGVVANVTGMIRGEGRIRWTANGVTSDGDFATDGLALAAAFGPVKGVKGRIHFSDLLALETPPGQIATIAEINPGIAVVDGVVRYRLLAGQVVKVEGGRWPFSGGELVLAPTELDFGRPVARAMTFRVTGMNAAEFVQQFELKNIAVTGIFDGTLPMVFGETGGRIVGGRLAVRPGGGTLAYVGEVSNAALGMFGRLAFDALKSMRYESLAIGLDGALDGELVSQVLFDGTNQTPKEATRGGLLGQLTGLPFRFRITIHAPFRGLLNSATSLNDPRGLIRQALPPKIDLPGSAPVQPPATRSMR